MSEKITPRMVEACSTLAGADAPLGPSEFARLFWGADKTWQRGNGPWGLGPDASGRHGGRMLTRLHRAGLVRLHDHGGAYTATLTSAGRALLHNGRKGRG